MATRSRSTVSKGSKAPTREQVEAAIKKVERLVDKAQAKGGTGGTVAQLVKLTRLTSYLYTHWPEANPIRLKLVGR
jgi:predicted amidohydrolase